MSEVRVRLAPSPTGPTHVGTAYQGLFGLLYVKKYGGQFVLRIEDTDQTRSRREYEDSLIQSLRWVGLEWDEGPDIGGPYGPYRQSERLRSCIKITRANSSRLDMRITAFALQNGSVICAPSSLRKKSVWATIVTVHLPAEEVQQRVASGERCVIRLKMPRQGSCIVRDRLRGTVELDYAQSDDQVLLKSDGFPTYHLAVVVDDHYMRITHVIRGEEWITSTPKHLVLYEAFGWDPPEYMHLPLLLNTDGTKMSKRRNPTSIEYYRRAGYLGDALLNYLALMAYPPLGEEEKFSLAQLSEHFDAERINLGGSIFDLEKLNWLNGRYVREDRTAEQIMDEMKAWLLNDEFIAQIVPLLQQRMETLGDFMPKAAFFLAREVSPGVDDLVRRSALHDTVQMLQTAIWTLEVAGMDRAHVEEAVRSVAQYWEWPVRDVTVPQRRWLDRESPPLFDTVLAVQDTVRMRLLVA